MASEDIKFLPSATPDGDKDSFPEEKELEMDELKLPLNDVDSTDEGLGGELTEDFQLEVEAVSSVPIGEDVTRDMKTESEDLNSTSTMSLERKPMECSSSVELTGDEHLIVEQAVNGGFVDRKITTVESVVTDIAVKTTTEEVRIEMEVAPDEAEFAEVTTGNELKLEIEKAASANQVSHKRRLTRESRVQEEPVDTPQPVNTDTIATYELRICMEEGDSEEEISRCRLRKKESFSIAIPGAKGRLPSDEIEGVLLHEKSEDIFEGDDIELEVVYPIDRTSV